MSSERRRLRRPRTAIKYTRPTTATTKSYAASSASSAKSKGQGSAEIAAAAREIWLAFGCDDPDEPSSGVTHLLPEVCNGFFTMVSTGSGLEPPDGAHTAVAFPAFEASLCKLCDTAVQKRQTHSTARSDFLASCRSTLSTDPVLRQLAKQSIEHALLFSLKAASMPVKAILHWCDSHCGNIPAETRQWFKQQVLVAIAEDKKRRRRAEDGGAGSEEWRVAKEKLSRCKPVQQALRRLWPSSAKQIPWSSFIRLNAQVYQLLVHSPPAYVADLLESTAPTSAVHYIAVDYGTFCESMVELARVWCEENTDPVAVGSFIGALASAVRAGADKERRCLVHGVRECNIYTGSGGGGAVAQTPGSSRSGQSFWDLSRAATPASRARPSAASSTGGKFSIQRGWGLGLGFFDDEDADGMDEGPSRDEAARLDSLVAGADEVGREEEDARAMKILESLLLQHANGTLPRGGDIGSSTGAAPHPDDEIISDHVSPASVPVGAAATPLVTSKEFAESLGRFGTSFQEYELPPTPYTPAVGKQRKKGARTARRQNPSAAPVAPLWSSFASSFAQQQPQQQVENTENAELEASWEATDWGGGEKRMGLANGVRWHEEEQSSQRERTPSIGSEGGDGADDFIGDGDDEFISEGAEFTASHKSKHRTVSISSRGSTPALLPPPPPGQGPPRSLVLAAVVSPENPSSSSLCGVKMNVHHDSGRSTKKTKTVKGGRKAARKGGHRAGPSSSGSSSFPALVRAKKPNGRAAYALPVATSSSARALGALGVQICTPVREELTLPPMPAAGAACYERSYVAPEGAFSLGDLLGTGLQSSRGLSDLLGT